MSRQDHLRTPCRHIIRYPTFDQQTCKRKTQIQTNNNVFFVFRSMLTKAIGLQLHILIFRTSLRESLDFGSVAISQTCSSVLNGFKATSSRSKDSFWYYFTCFYTVRRIKPQHQTFKQEPTFKGIITPSKRTNQSLCSLGELFVFYVYNYIIQLT